MGTAGGPHPAGVSGSQSRDHSCSRHICVAHVTGQATCTGAQPTGSSTALSPDLLRERPHRGPAALFRQRPPLGSRALLTGGAQSWREGAAGEPGAHLPQPGGREAS